MMNLLIQISSVCVQINALTTPMSMSLGRKAEQLAKQTQLCASKGRGDITKDDAPLLTFQTRWHSGTVI